MMTDNWRRLSQLGPCLVSRLPDARPLALVALAIAASGVLYAQNAVAPAFTVDPSWPKLPNNWMVGNGPSIAVDKHDNVWLLQRSQGLAAENKTRAAPPVIELDSRGNFVRAWGPGPGFEWPSSEHTIFVDNEDHVWICGAGPRDTIVLKFTAEGRFLMQIGKLAQTGGNADTKNLNRPSDIFVNSKTNEVFLSDGYGNRRVIVFDADTGAYKRMFGAFGNVPEGDRPPGPTAAGGGARSGDGGRSAPAAVDPSVLQAPQFQLPHSSTISNDGKVYVVDRGAHRMQLFTVDGKYVTQIPLGLEDPQGSASAVALSTDSEQSLLYVVDYGSSKILTFERNTLKLIGSFGVKGANPGEFQGVHDLAIDSKGNLYTSEVSPGNRFQKFLPDKLTK